MIAEPDWGDLPIDDADMCLDAESLPTAYAARINHLLPLFNYFMECTRPSLEIDFDDLAAPTCVQDGSLWTNCATYLAIMANYAVDWAMINNSEQLYPDNYMGNTGPTGTTERYLWSARYKDIPENDAAVRNKSRIIVAANALLPAEHAFTTNTLTYGDGVLPWHGTDSFFGGDHSHCPKYLNRLWAVLKILSDSFALDFDDALSADTDDCYHRMTPVSQVGYEASADIFAGSITWHDTSTTCTAIRSTAISEYATAGTVDVYPPQKSWQCLVHCDTTNQVLAPTTPSPAWGGEWDTKYYTQKLKLQGFAAAGVTLSDSTLVAWLRRSRADDMKLNDADEDGDLLVIQTEAGTADPIVTNQVIGNTTCPLAASPDGWDDTDCSDQHESDTVGPVVVDQGGTGSIGGMGVIKSIGSVSGLTGPTAVQDEPSWNYGGCNYIETWIEDDTEITSTIEYEEWIGGGDNYQYYPRLIVKNAAI